MVASASYPSASHECKVIEEAANDIAFFSMLESRCMVKTFAAQLELHDDHEVKVAPAEYVQSKLVAVKNKLRLLPGELSQEHKRVISDVVGYHVATKRGARHALVSLCGVYQVSDRSSETIRELQSISGKFDRVRCVLGMVPEKAPAGIWAVQSPTCGTSPTSPCGSPQRRRRSLFTSPGRRQ
jgi:hypothetical protein